MARRLSLVVLSGEYAVARLGAGDDVPVWARDGEFCSVTRTGDELSVVCRQDRVPDECAVTGGFVALKVSGPLAFSEVGVLESVATPLATAGISIFVVSTFDTDYIFLPACDFAAARGVLVDAGHEFSEQE